LRRYANAQSRRADHLDYEPGHGWNYSNVGYYFIRQKIEQITSQDIGSALRRDPLGLASVRLVPTVEAFAGTAWGNRSRYDPGWVYHGLLAGAPGPQRAVVAIYSGRWGQHWKTPPQEARDVCKDHDDMAAFISLGCAFLRRAIGWKQD
jgi:CubicO group peptidase (beta-lactamase class C family)